MRTISADKICRGGALLSFQLNFQQFEGCVVAAANYETIGLGMEFGGRQGAGCGACLRAVLRAGLNAAGLESAQGFDNEIGAAGGEARCQSFGGVVGRDGEGLLEEDVAGIESGVK